MVSISLTAIAFAAIAASSVDAHGTLAKPGLKFTGSAYGGDFSATVPMDTIKPLAGDKFTNYPSAEANAKAFGRAFKAQTKFATLKDFILKSQDMSKGRKKNPSTAECGFTDPTSGAVQSLPDKLEWYGGKMNHPGPCEVWCDDVNVLPFTGDCAETFPDGKITYDKAKCVGKNRLTLYWMSTLLEWQVYIDCAKIGNGSPTTSKPTTAPAVGGEATPAPAAGTKPATMKPATMKPTTAPATGAKPTTTPAATSKCKVRRE